MININKIKVKTLITEEMAKDGQGWILVVH